MHLIPTSLITTAAFAAYSMLNMPNNHENVLSLDVNGLDEFGIQSTIFSSKAKAVLSGGHDTCFLATINIQGTAFLVQIDTGSSDTAIPHSTLNQYTGPSVSYTIPAGQATTLYDSYGDTSFWKGYPARLSTTLGSTSIAALAPIALMTVQSTSPVFINSPSQGLMGVAYPPLSAISSSPITVMDAWFSSGKMAKNKLAVHGCPYSLISQAWIDFGDETPYVGCAGTNGTLNIATVSMPTQSYFTLNVFQISVDGVPVPLPSTFQEKASSYYGGVNWSILDSCTSNIMIPAVQLAALVSKITTSGGLSASLQNSQYLPSFLAGNVSLRITDAYFNYKLLPTLSFTIAASSGTAGNYSSVTLTLGPRFTLLVIIGSTFKWLAVVPLYL